MFYLSCLAVAFAWLIGPLQAEAQTRLTLASGGKTDYTIVVADDAIPAEKTAALQLQKYLDRITGASFPIASDAAVGVDAPQIVVGRGKRADAVLGGFDWTRVGADGIVIQTRGNRLVLAGDRPRGALYAVGEFLQSAANVRWWARQAETVPKNADLTVAPTDVVYTPVFAYRETFFNPTTPWRADQKGDPSFGVFAAWIHSNGHFQSQPPEWGDHYKIIGWCHTFFQLIPPQKYFSSHPGWFTDPSNHNLPCTARSPRRGEDGQLCFNAPGLVDEMAKNALALIRQNPAAGYISISQNDVAGNFCADPEAVAMVEREGSQSGPIIDFVNKVAEKIHAEFPGFKVETLAYSDGIRPPKTLRPAKDVLIRLAPLGADFGHPFDSDWNRETRDLMVKWVAIAPELFIWTYTTNFTNGLMPHPNWANFGSDIKYFAAHHVKGVFEQGNVYTSEVGDFVELRTWLTARLLWNPSLDQRALTDEFLRGYYGAAGPFLEEYLDLVENSFLAKNRGLAGYNGDFDFLDIAVMTRATELFNAAADAVRGNEELSDRVMRSRVSLDFAWLFCYNRLKGEAAAKGVRFLGPESLPQGIDAFKKYVERYKIERGGESSDIEQTLARLRG